MEKDNLELWKFSCERTQKRAEELAKLFVEFDGKNRKKDPLLEAVCKQALEKHEAKCKPVEVENFDNFVCNAWVNVDDLNKNEISKPAIESGSNNSDVNMELSEENEVENITESVTAMDITTNEITNEEIICIANNLKEAKVISTDKLSELSEIQIIYLLKLLVDSEDGIISICSTVSKDLDSRTQSVFASLICSHVLMDKAKESKLQGGILEATSQLLKSIPDIMGPQLLVPMLLQEGECSKHASYILDSCNTALTHTVFRRWLDEKRPQFTEDDFELLKKFLKSPVKDSETVTKCCALFHHISNTYASNMHFAKLLLNFIKSLKGSVNTEAKEKLSLSIVNNKTGLKKMLEKEMGKI